MKKPSFVSALLLCLALFPMEAQSSSLSELPGAIREFAASIQGKKPAEVHAAIVERFGAAQRNVGSGISIELWDLPEGVLEFHPYVGPTFSDSKTGKSFWLLATSNPVASNVLQSYEMLTLAEPDHRGNQYWLGNLEVGANSTYRFIDSGQNLDRRAAQSDNFFMHHPSGTVEVHYVGSIKPETRLETVAEGTTVARLMFTSSDRNHRATFFVTSSERTRRLAFSADKPLSFHMDTGWREYWQ